MKIHLRLLTADDLEGVLQLSILAWAPVFESFEQVLGSAIYTKIYPDWKTSQRNVVETICRDTAKYITWVAEADGVLAGFIVYELNDKDKTGEVQFLAVHPDYQNQGIGTRLNTFVLEKMKEHGMALAVVGTGGDPGHAPARATYEKAGYIGLPLVRYYKDL